MLKDGTRRVVEPVERVAQGCDGDADRRGEGDERAAPQPARVAPWRAVLLAAGVVAMLALVWRFGADAVIATLSRVPWWAFGLVCLLHGAMVAVDAWAWQVLLVRERASYRRLLAARLAGDAVNVLTALVSLGGEAVKAWLLRREVSYAESVPSLIVSKTAEVVAQTVLLVLGVAVAWAAATGAGLRAALGALLVVDVVGVGGFLAVQVFGVVGRVARLAGRAGLPADHGARLDVALRTFYREHPGRFAASVAGYFAGWVLAVFQAQVTLVALGLPGSLVTALLVESLWCGVRFATFYVPASLGTLEGANAVGFGALGFAPGAGLAFTLVRRGCQAVWIAVGVVVLAGMQRSRAPDHSRPAVPPASPSAMRV